MPVHLCLPSALSPSVSASKSLPVALPSLMSLLWFMVFILQLSTWQQTSQTMRLKAQRASTQSHTFFILSPSLSSLPVSLFLLLTAQQLGRLSAQGSAQLSSPLASPKLIFYSETVAPSDPSFHTCLTHTRRGKLIFFQIFRRPQKCWFVL